MIIIENEFEKTLMKEFSLLNTDGTITVLPGNGNGAKAFGQEIENSSQFATCQVQKAFQAMCLRPPSNAADRAQVTQITADFVSSNYNMKTVFAESAVYCMGQ